MTYPNTPIVPVSPLYIKGMQALYQDDFSIIILPGQCYDSTNTYPMTSTENTVISSTILGVNGLDIGVLSSDTWYYIYAIADPSFQTSVTTDYIFSASYASPVLPFGYGVFRRIGCFKTNVLSNISAFYQSGNGSSRNYQYENPINVLTGGISTIGNVDISATIPSIFINSFIYYPIYLNTGFLSGAITHNAFITNAQSSDPIIKIGGGVAATATQSASGMMLLNRSTSIKYGVSNAASSLNIDVSGFVDSI